MLFNILAKIVINETGRYTELYLLRFPNDKRVTT